MLNRFMLHCNITEFLFEKCEGAVESSSGMLFCKVIRLGSIPERCVFLNASDIHLMATQNSSQLPRRFIRE